MLILPDCNGSKLLSIVVAEVASLIVETDQELVIRASEAAKEALRNPAAGRKLAEEVAAAARIADNPEALVMALRCAGWAARELYDHQTASKLIAEAVRIARRNRLDSRLSEVLVTRSAIHLEEGRIDLARRDIIAARRHASSASLPDVAFAEALLEERAGKLSAAAAAYEFVVESSGKDRVDIVAKAYNNWGQASRLLGDLKGAKRRLLVAIDLASAFSPMLVAIATHNLAGVTGEAGRPVEALQIYDDALDLLKAAELPLGEHYLDKTHTFLSLRLLDEALGAVGRAIAELDVPGGSLMLGEALILRAQIAFEQKDYEACVAAADHSADLMSRQDRPGWRALGSLWGLRAEAATEKLGAEFFSRLKTIETDLAGYGDHVGLIDALMLKARVSMTLGRQQEAAKVFVEVARMAADGPILLRIQGRIAEALEAELVGDTRRLGRVSRSGLDDLERYRQSFASSELRARASAYGAELSEIGLRAALKRRRPMQVWSWLERARASVIGGAIASTPLTELAPLLAELRETRRRLTAASTDEGERPDLEKNLFRLEGKIRAASWKRTSQNDPAILAAPTQSRLAVLRERLKDRVLLEYGVIDGSLIAVVVSADTIRFVPLGSVDPVDDARRNLGFALQRLSHPRSSASADAARSSAEDALETLDKALLRPLVHLLGDHRHVVVVPPGELIGLPWGALPSLDDLAIRIVPSAMMWEGTQTTSPTSDRVVAVEGPDLAAAAAEVRLVRDAHPEAETLLGNEATCAAVLDAVEGAGLVHLACHGTLRSDSPTFSGFRMSDGPLTVHDLESLRSPAHHWVLAACDLGNPGTLSGSDLEGVLAALLGGGAGGVVAAITAVPDEVSAALMAPLHRALAAGAGLAEALNTAKQGLDQNDPMGYVTSIAFNCYGGG